jgi:ATP-dependent DNA helicase RecG
MSGIGAFSNQELETMLSDLESDRVERKKKYDDATSKKAREAVCAFANDMANHGEPGVLFIGACDDGNPSGIEVTDRLLNSLADMKTDGNILPLPALTVEKRNLKGADMAIVMVIPSDMPPVKYDGRIWIRAGSRRSVANEQEERILIEKRRYKNLPFDIHPMPTATLNDLSKSIFENDYLPSAFAEDVLEGNNRTYEERLASTRMIVSPDDATPTVLGILTLGKSPQDFLPGACVQFLRIEGTELTNPILDEKKFTGTLAEVLRRAEETLGVHNRTAMDVISAPTHTKNSAYPQAAIRQLLYNAVLHRTYERTNASVMIYWFDDRVEILSPGGPYGNVTPENFGRPGIRDYRNPNIAEVLKNLGFVQGFGRGIAIARKELEKNSNPPPEFQCEPSYVNCVIRKPVKQ